MVFDGCGNRTSLNGVAQTFDNLNQLTPGAGISYNAKGDLTAWNGWACTYDAQNRLISASSASSTLSFYYDGKNRQIARSINGAITFSVWDDWELVEEYTTGNVRTAAFVQGAHGPIKSLLNNIYFYQDSLGSTSHIANTSGALLEYYKYDLNGKPTFWSPPPLNTQLSASNYGVRDLFTGERFISEMGMYDLRNRFYSPELGRFLQPDPIGFKGDASNLYRYCGNDWANMTDPLGLQAGHQSSDDKCTNAFNLPDWLYKDMRGLNSSQPAGNVTVALTDATSANEGPKNGKSMHQRAVEMLKGETRGNTNQAGIVTDGPPYRVGPVDGKKVEKIPGHPGFGYKDQELETLKWRGPRDQKYVIVHYHSRGGPYGNPTERHDLEMVKRAPMYFTNKDWAAQGKYQILRDGRLPETHFDRSIIPPAPLIDR